ncbi:MAG: hypothetical protein ACRC4M_04240, partial [Mycoplasma sp.]
QDLQSFISDINLSQEKKYLDYANSYILNEGQNVININSLSGNIYNILNIDIDKYDGYKPYYEIIKFSQLRSPLNIISGKIKISYLNNMQSEPIQLIVKPELIENYFHSISIEEYLELDEKTDSIKYSYSPGMKGIFIEKDASIKIETDIKIEYNRKIRTLNSMQIINFKYSNSNELGKMIMTKNGISSLEGGYNEIQSQEIF